jgi:hypothetical protein
MMGISADNFHHDQMLERASHRFLLWWIEGTDLTYPERRTFMRERLREVQDSCRGAGKEAVRFRSPHRRLAAMWELMVIDWLDDTSQADPMRATSLAHCCARIVSASLDLPRDILDRVTKEARAEMGGVIARFQEEAGRSGATLDALSETKGAA